MKQLCLKYILFSISKCFFSCNLFVSFFHLYKDSSTGTWSGSNYIFYFQNGRNIIFTSLESFFTILQLRAKPWFLPIFYQGFKSITDRKWWKRWQYSLLPNKGGICMQCFANKRANRFLKLLRKSLRIEWDQFIGTNMVRGILQTHAYR